MTAVETAPVVATGSSPRPVAAGMPPIRPIPFPRLVTVELRKMFDTRAGLWLMGAVVVASVLASGAVVLFAPDSAIEYSTFAAAFGFPMSVILPVIAILGVTAEWSQRTGLASFTMVPHRGRLIGAKLAATLLVAVASMGLAMVIGVAGNALGSTLAGVPAVWDATPASLGMIVLGNILGTMFGFVVAVLLRSTPAAIVTFFVFTLMVPTLTQMLENVTTWFGDVRPWVDYPNSANVLYSGSMSAEAWTHLGVTTLIWVVLPALIGTRMVLRAEVK